MKRIVIVIFFVLYSWNFIFAVDATKDMQIVAPHEGKTYKIGDFMLVAWNTLGIEIGSVKIILRRADGSQDYILKDNHPYDQNQVNCYLKANIIPGDYFVKVRFARGVSAKSGVFKLVLPEHPCDMRIQYFSFKKQTYSITEDIEFQFTVKNNSSFSFTGGLNWQLRFIGLTGDREVRFGSNPVPNDFQIAPGTEKTFLNQKIRASIYSTYFESLPKTCQAELTIRFTPQGEERYACRAIYGTNPSITIKEEEKPDLAFSECYFSDLAGNKKDKFTNGQMAKLVMNIKNKGTVSVHRFLVQARSIVGRSSPRTLALKGSLLYQKIYNLTIEKELTVTWTGLVLKERNPGQYTMTVEITALNPRKEANPNDNHCNIPFQILYQLNIKNIKKGS